MKTLRIVLVALVALATGVVGQPAEAQAYDWSTVTVDSGNVDGAMSIAVDANGNPMISYTNRITHELTFAVCERAASANGNCDQADDWSLTAITQGHNASIAVDANGNPMISYGTRAAPHPRFAMCDRSASTNGNCDQSGDWSTVLVHAVGDWGSTADSIAVDTSGNPMIAGYKVLSDGVKFAICDMSATGCDDTGDWSVPTVDAVGRGFAVIAVDASGNPMIAYSRTGLWFAICDRLFSTNGNCDRSEDWTKVQVDPVAETYWTFKSIAADASGDPMISYYADDGHLKFAMCDMSVTGCDETGDWTKVTLAWPGYEQGFIGLDINGDPMISYYGTGHVRFAICDMSATGCDETGDWSYEAVDLADRDSSIAVDGNGHAMISYQSYTDYDLKFATALLPPPPVGGIAELPDTSGSSGRNYMALAALAAAALLALTAAAWYAKKRRWLA